ncbi:hypothetical protein [Agrobacterium tumefaciens]|uniref:hypothetical protein n=1 Tax=Agrobacterium tumefaciens TaxID=358 RepID=UPI003BA19BB2
MATAKNTALTSKRSRKPAEASAFDVLRSMTADFGDPEVQAVFPDAAKALKKAKKIARAFVAFLKAKARDTPNVRYHTPIFAMKNGAYYFGDMLDGAITPFLSQKPSAAATVFSMEPLVGITAAEAANIFLFDEEELLVPLTALALTLPEQAKKGKTDAVVAHQVVNLMKLISHLETGVNVHGYVDLPRETKA